MKFLRVCGIAQVGDGGVGVFDGMGEGEVAGRTPGAAVVEVDDVPPIAADGLGEVEIFLVAGEAVQEEDYGMWCRAGSDIGDGVEERAVAGDLEGFEGGGIGLVVGGVGGDGGGKLLSIEGERKKGAEKRGGEMAVKAHG